MKRLIRNVIGLGLLMTGGWAGIAATTMRLRQRRLAIIDCPENDPECHGTVGLAVELERPDGTEVVVSNEFVLQGHITLQSGTRITEATLLIQGRPPSSLPFKEIDLMNGELGSVVMPQGGRFMALVKNQLFCEAIQVVPYQNDISVFVRDAVGRAASVGGTIINLSCLFIRPFRPTTE